MIDILASPSVKLDPPAEPNAPSARCIAGVAGVAGVAGIAGVVGAAGTAGHAAAAAWALVLGLLLGSPAAQDPLTRQDFDVKHPPRGVVVDTDGKPIAGVTVRFRIEPDSLDGVAWRNHILRQQPLPEVRSGRDGEFFLPLTDLHRLFTRQTAGNLSLLCECEGYHPWVEPLSDGLRGYLGSRVVLRRVEPADMLRVDIDKPLPGMWLRVHRVGVAATPHLDLERWYPVPASGRVDAVVSLVPSPLMFGALNNLTLPVGVEVQLLHPGRTEAPVGLRYGQRELRFVEAAPAVETVCALARADGRPLQRPRGLYRCPDASLRWFPVVAARVVQSRHLTLLAVEDEGCLAVHVPFIDPSQATITLPALPAAAERALLLVRADHEVVEQAEVSFFDLSALPERLQGNRLGHQRARRRLMVRDGAVALPDSALPGPGFLVIQVPGFKPQVLFEPRQIVGSHRIALGVEQSHGTLELTVVDEDDKPVAGAHVVMNSQSFELGAFGRGSLRTDRAGRVEIDHLGPGNHVVQLLGPGFTMAYTTVRLRRAGERVSQKVTVARSAEYRIQVVDDADRPVPFAAVRVAASAANRVVQIGALRTQTRANSVLTADSRGRILLSEYPTAMQPRVADLFDLVPVASEPLDAAEPVSKVRVGRLESVVMPLPPASVSQECLLINTRVSVRTVPQAAGTARTTRTAGTAGAAGAAGASLLLARLPAAMPDAVLSVYLDGAAPLRLSADLVAAARRTQQTRPLVIDQRAVARRLRFAFSGIGEVPVEQFRLEVTGLNFRNGLPYIYGDSGLRVRPDAAGEWSVGLRHHSGFDARILHPQFLMQTVDVPAAAANDGKAAGADAPVAVRLERGTSVRFKIRSRSPLVPSARVSFHVHSLANQMLLYQSEQLGEAMRKTGARTWELRSPVALRPGKYRFTLRIVGTRVNMQRREFTVPESGELVIDVDDNKVQLGANPWAKAGGDGPEDLVQQARVAAMETSIKLLAARIAALRQLGETDAKSKARLQAKLVTLEQRLAALQKDLDRVKAAAPKPRQKRVAPGAKQRGAKRPGTKQPGAKLPGTVDPAATPRPVRPPVPPLPTVTPLPPERRGGAR